MVRQLRFQNHRRSFSAARDRRRHLQIVVQDKKTGEPIETGQGRIFATSNDGANTDDGLAKGKEVGTYYGRLFFPTTGDWAVRLQFRRDSTSAARARGLDADCEQSFGKLSNINASFFSDPANARRRAQSGG